MWGWKICRCCWAISARRSKVRGSTGERTNERGHASTRAFRSSIDLISVTRFCDRLVLVAPAPAAVPTATAAAAIAASTTTATAAATFARTGFINGHGPAIEF